MYLLAHAPRLLLLLAQLPPGVPFPIGLPNLLFSCPLLWSLVLKCSVLSWSLSECRVRCLRGLQQDPLLSVSGRCPSCWSAYIASMPRPVTGRQLSEDMPSLEEVLSARVRLRPSVPQGLGTFGVPASMLLLVASLHIGTPGLDRFSSAPFPSPSLAGTRWFQSHETFHQRKKT